nr:hypothetical protein [uncultured Flavobacterium sp.]
MKKSKIHLPIILCILLTQFVFSQSSIIPDIKSPNTSSMQRFGEIPVSLFTGTPDNPYQYIT